MIWLLIIFVIILITCALLIKFRSVTLLTIPHELRPQIGTDNYIVPPYTNKIRSISNLPKSSRVRIQFTDGKTKILRTQNDKLYWNIYKTPINTSSILHLSVINEDDMSTPLKDPPVGDYMVGR